MLRNVPSLSRRVLARAQSSAAPTRVAALRSRLADEDAELQDFARPAAAGPSQPWVPPAQDLQQQLQLGGGPAPELLDRFARQHTYLRISLTERCSLRCVYCMPAGGVDLTPNAHLMQPDEMLRIARLFVGAGVNKIRLTGGEPTVRRDLPEIISALNDLRPLGLENIAITSNGIALPRMLPTLVSNGLNKLNISLDTLDKQRFLDITRRDGLGRVLKAIDLAIELGLTPLKLNVVLMAGHNDDELLDFVALSRDRPIDVRFIEYMPFDGNRWKKSSMVTLDDMLGQVKAAHPGLARVQTDPHDVAVTWRLPEAHGSVSFIASMTQPFCGGCNRVRLTADGNLKVCLFGSAEVSLRDAMREGATDAELMGLVGGAVGRKHKNHAGMDVIAATKNRPMTTIGG